MRHGDSGSALLAALQLRRASGLPRARLLADRSDCDKAGQPEPAHADVPTEGSLSAATAELHQLVNKSVNQWRTCTRTCSDVGGFNRSLSQQIQRVQRQADSRSGTHTHTHRRDVPNHSRFPCVHVFVHVTRNTNSVIESIEGRLCPQGWTARRLALLLRL